MCASAWGGPLLRRGLNGRGGFLSLAVAACRPLTLCLLFAGGMSLAFPFFILMLRWVPSLARGCLVLLLLLTLDSFSFANSNVPLLVLFSLAFVVLFLIALALGYLLVPCLCLLFRFAAVLLGLGAVVPGCRFRFVAMATAALARALFRISFALRSFALLLRLGLGSRVPTLACAFVAGLVVVKFSSSFSSLPSAADLLFLAFFINRCCWRWHFAPVFAILLLFPRVLFLAVLVVLVFSPTSFLRVPLFFSMRGLRRRPCSSLFAASSLAALVVLALLSLRRRACSSVLAASPWVACFCWRCPLLPAIAAPFF
mmetsp:Transcript_18856/g.40502  ORF Transcript_18856/g.40502 Transcript_18856/m.40502 type:complete len:313 (+) Transcript_18856:555-1493(+)